MKQNIHQLELLLLNPSVRNSTEQLNQLIADTLELSENVILATYKVTSNNQCSLRSSIWKFQDNMWQIVFHQGTHCESGEQELCS